MRRATVDRPPRPRARSAAIDVRRLRLASGLVLFAYVTLHFLNHALGNVSVAAMESGLVLQKLLWQSLPGALLLYAALLAHMGLGFYALYQRRQFRWTRLEATQLALGLVVPFLLADHVFGTRVSLSLFGTDKGYAQELAKFANPQAGVPQIILLVIVWIHGCIGIHFWLGLKPFYPRTKTLLTASPCSCRRWRCSALRKASGRSRPSLADPAWRAPILTLPIRGPRPTT